MSTFWAFNHRENKHTLYCGKDCLRFFCESLRKHAKNIIDFEKQKVLLLTKEELKSRQDVKVCYICGRIILRKLPKSINYWKVRDHYHFTGRYRGAAYSVCSLKFHVPNETACSSLYDCLNFRELLARIRRKFCRLSDCNWTWTHNHLVCKRILNHLAKLAKWLSCVVSTSLSGAFDCMSLLCHVSISDWIQTL